MRRSIAVSEEVDEELKQTSLEDQIQQMISN